MKEEEKELGWDEIQNASKKLKDGKAARMDGVPGEIWKYGGGIVEKWLWNFCNRVWMGQGWPESWKKREIVPIIKKGKGDIVEEYRGITLTPSAYKVYATVLAKKIREKVERGGIIPQNQAGFRRGMGTMDNVFMCLII